MNVTPSRVTRTLNDIGMTIKNIRTDGIWTIQNGTGKIRAAYNPLTRMFWIKDQNHQKNGNFRRISDQVMSINDLRYCAQQALEE